MVIINKIVQDFLELIKKSFNLVDNQVSNVSIILNVDKEKQQFGDLNCNAALVLSKIISKNPRVIAEKIKDLLLEEAEKKDSIFKKSLREIKVAGPGFINLYLSDYIWKTLSLELFKQKKDFFLIQDNQKKFRYLIEFVSANPTGPLHLGHGRGGVIGDVLGNVLSFIGHYVEKEFYINDAGNQIKKLGLSFKIRCQQKLGFEKELPEDAYRGDYLTDLASLCIKEFGEGLLKKDDSFFQTYAKKHLLSRLKADLKNYGIEFDNWFSEKKLHDSGKVKKALEVLQKKDLVYEKDGALWFRSTKFGDDKDRVVRKSSGELTYIAADIAYHEDKFKRGFDKIVDILGQDHHGYIKRLKSTMQALGFDPNNLDVILYQLVSLKNEGELIRMSKRAGHFTTLKEVIDIVGVDVARFFYLNRKADAHLDFDLSVALKKTDENPVFYIQYAFVRTKGILKKAEEVSLLSDFVSKLVSGKISAEELEVVVKNFDVQEFSLIKKLISLSDTLNGIARTYQTHLLSYYILDLAHVFHNYYANNRIIDAKNIELTKARLFMVVLVRYIFTISLELLEIKRPEKM